MADRAELNTRSFFPWSGMSPLAHQRVPKSAWYTESRFEERAVLILRSGL